MSKSLVQQVPSSADEQDDSLLAQEAPLFFDEENYSEYVIPGIRLVRFAATTLDIPTAEEFLKFKEVTWERPLDKAHVRRLDGEVSKKRFCAEMVVLVVANIKGERKLRRLNGQHTATMVKEQEIKPGEKPFSLYVGTAHFEVANEDALRLLYTMIDMGKYRGKADILRAFLASGSDITGKHRSTINLVSAGFVLFNWETSRKQRASGDEIAELLNGEFNSLYSQVFDFLLNMKGSYSQHLRRGPVVAAMFEVFQADPEHGAAFFHSVLEGANLPKNDPRLVLRDYLPGVKLGSSGTIDRESLFRVCVLAWNYHCDGTLISSIRDLQTEARGTERPQTKKPKESTKKKSSQKTKKS